MTHGGAGAGEVSPRTEPKVPSRLLRAFKRVVGDAPPDAPGKRPATKKKKSRANAPGPAAASVSNQLTDGDFKKRCDELGRECQRLGLPKAAKHAYDAEGTLWVTRPDAAIAQADQLADALSRFDAALGRLEDLRSGGDAAAIRQREANVERARKILNSGGGFNDWMKAANTLLPQ